MRILFLSTWFPYPPDNGSKLRVYHLLRALARAHEVTLVSFSFGTAKPDEQNDLQAWCQDIHVVSEDPFAVNQAGTLHTFLSLRPVASRPIPAMSQLVAVLLQSGEFDVVIASTEMTADYTLMAPNGTVKILEAHNSMTRWAHDWFKNAPSPLHRVRHWVSLQKRRRFEAQSYPRFDLLTMVSEDDRQMTIKTAGPHAPPVAIIPNGVDTQHNKPGLAAVEGPNLVYNGALTYVANYGAMQYFLAEIYPLVKRAEPEVSLTITGSIKGVALDGLALEDSVQLTGYVDDVRLPVAAAAVCIAPIRLGSGTRLKILEAMALGTPVVATTKAAEGLDVIDGKHLLLADSSEAFAASILDLLRNPQLRRHLAGNARRLVEDRYDWDQIGMKFAALVEQTAGRKEADFVNQ